MFSPEALPFQQILYHPIHHPSTMNRFYSVGAIFIITTVITICCRSPCFLFRCFLFFLFFLFFFGSTSLGFLSLVAVAVASVADEDEDEDEGEDEDGW